LYFIISFIKSNSEGEAGKEDQDRVSSSRKPR